MKTTNQFRNNKISILLFLTALILFPLISNAQINLNSTGGVSVGSSTITPTTGLNVNSGGVLVSGGVSVSGGTVPTTGLLVNSGGAAISGGTVPSTGLLVNTGDINLKAATNAYQINGADVLWHNNNTANIFVGINAGFDITTGSYNSFLGYNAGANTTNSSYNSFMGYGAGTANTTSSYNSAFGYNALASNTTGTGYNSAFGVSALALNTGNSNTAFGYFALVYNTTGNYNTAVGLNSCTTNSTGSNNTCVGYGSNVASGALTNATAIGNGASVSASNKVRIGNSSVTVIEGQVAWTSVSDGRFKTNIKDEVEGLSFIKKLRPVSYQLDTKKFDEFLTKNMPDSIKALYSQGVDYAASSSVIHTGFIAQEVEQAAKDCKYNFDGVHAPVDDNDNYGIAYSQFVVPLVKAVQEQQQMIEDLTANTPNANKQDSIIKALNAKVADLQKQISNCCSNIIYEKALINNDVNSTNTGINSGSSVTNGTSITTTVLYQNIPNPFNQSTSIQYAIPTATQNASIMVFDLNGKLIKTIPITIFGNAAITINGNELSPGMFVYSLIVDGKIIDTKRMILTE